MVNAKIVVLDPTSRGKLKESITAKRPASLEGKVMGIVWNGKPGGDALLERFGELLTERFRFSEVLRLYAQADVTNSLTEAEINELAKRCAFVLLGVGDWGGCSLWCIHNAMEFEKRGVFTTTVCTSGFASLLKKTSEAKGFPNLAIVTVSHPIGGIELSKVREKADGAFSDIIKVLTEPSEKLSGAISK